MRTHVCTAAQKRKYVDVLVVDRSVLLSFAWHPLILITRQGFLSQSAVVVRLHLHPFYYLASPSSLPPGLETLTLYYSRVSLTRFVYSDIDAHSSDCCC